MAIYRGHKVQKQLILPQPDIRKVQGKIDRVSALASMEKIEGNEKNFDELRRLIIELNDVVDYLKEVYSVTEGL